MQWHSQAGAWERENEEREKRAWEREISTWVKLIVHLSLRVERSRSVSRSPSGAVKGDSETTHSPERCGSSQHFEKDPLSYVLSDTLR